MARIREVTDLALRYHATAHLRTEHHEIAERDLLISYMRGSANVMALLENDDLGDRAMLDRRREIVQRYLEGAKTDPWDPPPRTVDSDDIS